MKTELSTKHAALLSPQIWGVMKDQATVLVRSGFLPESVKTAEQAMAIMMKGHEVGFSPMQAFAMINVIKGKPCLGAEGQMALIYMHCPGAKIDLIKLEDDCCVIEASRPGGKKTVFKYDSDDAKMAQLLGKDNWKKFPRAMCRSRCVSEMARSIFPDAIMGFSHTAEELDPDVSVNEDGEIINVSEPKQKALPPKPVEQVPEIFVKNSDDMREKLHESLKHNGVPEEIWHHIEEDLDGKAITKINLKTVVKEPLERFNAEKAAKKIKEEQQVLETNEAKESYKTEQDSYDGIPF